MPPLPTNASGQVGGTTQVSPDPPGRFLQAFLGERVEPFARRLVRGIPLINQPIWAGGWENPRHADSGRLVAGRRSQLRNTAFVPTLG